MNKELIMKSDVLDILFENRNKNYGAYDLRKFYTNRLKKALGMMMTIAVVFSAFTFLHKKTNLVDARIFVIPDPKLQEIKEPEKKQEAPKSEVKTTTVTQKALSNPPLIVDNNLKTDIIPTINENDVIGSTTVNVPGSGAAVVQPANSGNGPSEQIAPGIDRSTTYGLDAVDVPPSYPGGMDALRKFLERNLHNPRDMEEGESVNVRIKFVVDYNGKLQSFVTLVDGGEEFNKEVVRVLKKMPEWIPGKAKGENVSVYYTIPVKFVPSD